MKQRYEAIEIELSSANLYRLMQVFIYAILLLFTLVVQRVFIHVCVGACCIFPSHRIYYFITTTACTA